MERDYFCSNCGAHFTSKAKKKSNARHKCEDGKTGSGRLLDRSDPPREPLPEDEPFTPPTPKADEVEIVDGDAEFALEEPQEIEPDSDLEYTEPTMAPVGEEPRPEPKKKKPTPKQDATQIQEIFKAFYAATGSVELTPEEEMEIVAGLWAGVGEVHIDTGQVHVPAWMYIGTAGILTALIMGRRQYSKMEKDRREIKPPSDLPKKKGSLKKGWEPEDSWR